MSGATTSNGAVNFVNLTNPANPLYRPITGVDLDNAFNARPVMDTNGSLHIGPRGWLEAIVGFASEEDNAQSAVLSQKGSTALLGASRTSDGPTTGGDGAFGIAAIAIADSLNPNALAWAGYFEVRRYPGVTGGVLGIEVGVVNQGNSIHSTPFTDPGGSTSAYRCSAGRADVPNDTNPSYVFGVIGSSDGVKFNSGFIFFNDPIAPDPTLGKPIVLDMTVNQTLVWRNASDGNAGLQIGSDTQYTNAQSSGATTTFRANNTGYVLTNGNGAGFNVSGTTVNVAGTAMFANGVTVAQAIGLQGTIQATGLHAYSNDAGAAVGGIPISGLYIAQGTGALTIRQS